MLQSEIIGMDTHYTPMNDNIKMAHKRLLLAEQKNRI